MIDQVKLYVNEEFQQNRQQILHFELTLYWLNEFHYADEAFQVAAYSHDMERAQRNEAQAKIPLISPHGFRDPEFLKHHQEQGARRIADYLKSQAYPEQLCERVYSLVSTHEVGGDFEQNLLKDCDSLSFFETQVDNFIIKKVPEVGVSKVRAKFDWMFSRITASEVQEHAWPLYQSAINHLITE